MRVLAFDTGPSECGWALLEVRGTTGRYLGGGACSSTFDGLRVVLEQPHDELAIEGPEATIFDGRAAAGPLFRTHWVGGRLEALAHAMAPSAAPAIVLAPSVWRRTFTGARRPGAAGFRTRDGQIKALVVARVTGLPKRFNVHVADACGLALVAGWMAQRSAA